MNCMPDDNSKVGKQKDLIRLPLPSPLCPVSNNEIYVCNTMYKVCMWCECEMWTQIDDNSGAKNPICLPLPSSLLGLMMDTRHETHLWYLIYPCQQLSSSSSSTEQKHVECYIYIYSRAHNKMSWWYVYTAISLTFPEASSAAVFFCTASFFDRGRISQLRSVTILVCANGVSAHNNSTTK